ncbi:ACP S-malonyltransferase [Streptomyces sp. NRRL F-5650]|uniref:ACP S-malonyltransferase n=1 Tax=Streptomyces sp. NRRL F-5650 TaxID=1463868 RepID=UPI0004C5BEB8|nr:ACP S-malonyltransferase [Streptomyces sp. NRRL F-5650]
MTERSLPTVFMFSGQGSQYYQMARDLYENEPAFTTAMDRLDSVARDELGASVVARIYDDGRSRAQPFLETAVTHPAIVMVELALAEMLMSEGIQPDVLLGASLGEFVGAVLAGVLDESDCLRLLIRQARALDDCPRGGMLAVLGPPSLHAELAELRDGTDLAARNYDQHFVVSGSEEALAAAEARLRRLDVPYQRVPVEQAFHSRLMDPAYAACAAAMEGVRLGAPRLPLVSCAAGAAVTELTAGHFWTVAREPIEFQRAVAHLEEQGPHRYLDLGPSGTLHNFVRNNLGQQPRSVSFPLLSPFGRNTALLRTVREEVTERRTAPAAARQSAAAPDATAPDAPPATHRKGAPMKVYGFPGQGSQVKGMGKGLFEEFPELTATADRVLGYSVARLCVEDPDKQLSLTEFTQPALYVVGALSYLKKTQDDPEPPDCLIGHSLGEYVALFAAGVFDFETGLRLVQRRALLTARAEGGGMAAVVGCEQSRVEEVLRQPELSGLAIANYNSPEQFVITGPREEIDRARAFFESERAFFTRLRVSGAFHSESMRPASEEFAEFLSGFQVSSPSIPVVSNADARPYPAERAALCDTLTRQIYSGVQWIDTVRYLMGRDEDFVFEEVGPGTVLTKLVRKIREKATPLPAVAPDPAPARSPAPESRPEPLPEPALASAPAPAAPAPARPAAAPAGLTAENLGAASFRERYGLRLAYLAGSMYRGVSGAELVARLAKAGSMGFLGTGGLSSERIEEELRTVHAAVGDDAPFGAALQSDHADPDRELALVDLLLRYGVRTVEASGHLQITSALVKYRLKGGRVIAKVTRADMARQFLAPPPAAQVDLLVEQGHLTHADVQRHGGRPVADDLCVEGTGWRAQAEGLATLLPTVLRLRDELATDGHRVHVGAAGGLGTPEAVAAAFLLGAEFVLTGSVNQCTVQAATSEAVKDMLQNIEPHEVEAAPWVEEFELGRHVHSLKRGVFLPARAAKLHDLWRRHGSFEEIDAATRTQLEEKYLRTTFEAAWARVAPEAGTAGAPDREAGGRRRLALVFRDYLDGCLAAAAEGDPRRRVEYAVHCGPALGAFNSYVAGTDLEDWRGRDVDLIADRLMAAAAQELRERCARLLGVAA